MSEHARVVDVDELVDHLVGELERQGVDVEDEDPDDWAGRVHPGEGRLP
jgi:hypothetical protein